MYVGLAASLGMVTRASVFGNHSDSFPMIPQNASQPDTAALRRAHNEQYGIREGAYTAIMQGAGENYLTAFALTLQASTSQIGMLNTLPAFNWDLCPIWIGRMAAMVRTSPGSRCRRCNGAGAVVVATPFSSHGVSGIRCDPDHCVRHSFRGRRSFFYPRVE